MTPACVFSATLSCMKRRLESIWHEKVLVTLSHEARLKSALSPVTVLLILHQNCEPAVLVGRKYVSKWVSVVSSIDPCSVEVFNAAADAAAGDYPSTRAGSQCFTCSLDALMWALFSYQNCFEILFKSKSFYVLWTWKLVGEASRLMVFQQLHSALKTSGRQLTYFIHALCLCVCACV